MRRIRTSPDNHQQKFADTLKTKFNALLDKLDKDITPNGDKTRINVLKYTINKNIIDTNTKEILINFIEEKFPDPTLPNYCDESKNNYLCIIIRLLENNKNIDREKIMEILQTIMNILDNKDNQYREEVKSFLNDPYMKDILKSSSILTPIYDIIDFI